MLKDKTNAERTPRVFVFEPCEKHDIRTVTEYGEIVYLFPVDGQRAGMASDDLEGQIRKTLDVLMYQPAEDYILVAGAVPLIAQFVATVAGHWGNVRLLLFDARRRRYIFREIGELQQ